MKKSRFTDEQIVGFLRQDPGPDPLALVGAIFALAKARLLRAD